MNFTSFYLRTFFGAKPFASNEMDELAKKMGVEGALSPDKNDRYFIIANRNVTAANLGKKLIFGRRYYESLTEPQRMAASAHELAHIMVEDDRRFRIVLLSLSVSVLLSCTAYAASASILLAECAFCCSFLGLVTSVSSRDDGRSRKQEFKCDSIAVSFVGGDAMLASIRLAESMLDSRRMGGGLLMFWRGRKKRETQKGSGGTGHHPTVEERALAIMKTVGST